MKHDTMRTFMGHELWPVQSADSAAKGYRWYRQIFHCTGMRYDEQWCPKYRSLADAKDEIRTLNARA